MHISCENSEQLKALTYFHKKLHFTCLPCSEHPSAHLHKPVYKSSVLLELEVVVKTFVTKELTIIQIAIYKVGVCPIL